MDRLSRSKQQSQDAPEQALQCSFCNRSSSRLTTLSSGSREAYACADCLAICEEILESEPDTLQAHPREYRSDREVFDKLKVKLG